MPLLLVSAPFLVGLALGSTAGGAVASSVAVGLFLASGPRAPRTWVLSVLLAYGGLGSLRGASVEVRPGWTLLEGTVARSSIPSVDRARLRLTDVAAASWPKPPRFAAAPDIDLHGPRRLARCGAVGDRIRVLAHRLPPIPPASPWWPSRHHAEIRGREPICLRVGRPGPPGAPGPHRARLETALARLSPGPGRAIVRALVSGDRSEIDGPTREAFSDAGVGHLLAISGLHLALVGGAAGWLARRLARCWPAALETGVEPRIGAVAAAVAGWGFAVLVGAPPSASRAAGLLAVHALGRCGRRSPCPLSSLAATVIVLLAFEPSWFGDVGFALSVSAVFGLILGAPRAPRGSGLLPGLVASVRVGAVAAASTTPWLLASFGRASVVAPISNVLAVPWASFVVLPLSLAGAGLSIVSPAAGAPVLGLAAGASGWLAAFAAGVAAWPGAAVTLGAHWAGPSALLLGGLALARSRTRLSVALASAGLGWGFAGQPGPSVTFLPVGHGDSAVIRTSGGRHIVIDTGTPPAFESVVSTALRRAGARRIDLLVLSHADADHAGGAPLAQRRFRPLRVIDGTAGLPAELMIDEARLRFWGPPSEPRGRISDNDRSLVVKLRLGSCEVLFAGDLERAGEASLVRKAGDRLRSDVLKVPHHGSDTSSSPELLARVQPRLAVVSVGPNPHGLPDAAALGRLRRAGARVLRTDRVGPVRLECDGPGRPSWRTGRD